MTLKEKMTIEKFEKISTSELVKIYKTNNKWILLNNECLCFCFYLLIFILPSILCAFSNLNIAISTLPIFLITYLPFWFLLYKPMNVSPERVKVYKKINENIDFVLQHRTKNPH